MIIRRPAESGNIVFLILIAVVLFAALTFAISQGSRNQSSDDVNNESARMAASRMTQHSVDLEAAILRLKTVRGVADTQISFETPGMPGYVNPQCTSDQCRLYLADGGAISYTNIDPSWLQGSDLGRDHYGYWIMTGGSCVPGVGGGTDNSCNADPANNELIAIIPWIKRDICVQMNRKLNIPMTNDQPPILTGTAWNPTPEFVGSFDTGQVIIDTGNVLFGKPEGCFEGRGSQPAGTYHYYRVVVPR